MRRGGRPGCRPQLCSARLPQWVIRVRPGVGDTLSHVRSTSNSDRECMAYYWYPGVLYPGAASWTVAIFRALFRPHRRAIAIECGRVTPNAANSACRVNDLLDSQGLHRARSLCESGAGVRNKTHADASAREKHRSALLNAACSTALTLRMTRILQPLPRTHYRGNVSVWQLLARKLLPRVKFRCLPRSGASLVFGPGPSWSGMRRERKSWFLGQGATRPKIFIVHYSLNGPRSAIPSRK